jgi:hypothetical protein
MTAIPLTQAQLFGQLRDAAAEAGLRLVDGYPEQGGYWLSHGIHTTWLPDLKAVNRALVTGCELHRLYPEALRLVAETAPAVPANTTPKVSPWVRETTARAQAVLASDEPAPQSVAEIRAAVERRRAERAAANGNEWWRKDPTPQNMRKRVQP